MPTQVNTSATTRDLRITAQPNVVYASRAPRGVVYTITPHEPTKR